MKIETKGTKELRAKIDGIIRKQMPFAISVALNDTANDVKKGVERQLERDIDRPTPFTRKAFAVQRSNKRNLTSAVFIKNIQAGYLKPQILGGKRVARKGKPILIPAYAAKKNKYGNLPRNKLKGLNAKGKLFKADRLIVQKMARKNKGVAYSAKDATYKPRFKFYERAKTTAVKSFPNRMQKALTKALLTARIK